MAWSTSLSDIIKVRSLAVRRICYVTIVSFNVLLVVSFYNMTGLGSEFGRNRTGVRYTAVSRLPLARGGPTWSSLYELDIIQGKHRNLETKNDNFSCIDVSYELVIFPMCLYDNKEDAIISKTIRQTGRLFELADLTLFLRHMTSGMGLIDVGANLGTYTLPAAHLGYPVVAVEMTPRTARRLRQSVILGHVRDNVKLINAAASNVYTEYYVGHDYRNMGDAYYVTKAECDTMRNSDNQLVRCDPSVKIPTILLDDLVDVVGFKTGAMKIDAQGAELFVFQNASKLFEVVDIKLVLLEWVLFGEELRKVRSASTRMSEREMLIHNMVDFFLSRNYKPYTTNLTDLSNTPRKSWSYNVIFKK